MANYSLVINSKFKPFSYQELLAPALMSTQAHQAVEDAYSELATKANIWDKMTDPGSKAHGMYEAYARDLEQQAEQLSRYGLTPSSRQQMLNMKSRYSSDIVPIEQAYKRREEQIAEQRKAGNSMIYDYDAQTTSLDRFIENPALSYRSIDRKDLYTRAVTDFGQYAKALSDYGNGKKLDNFTKTFVQSYGITPEQARNFITAMRTGNVDTADPTLRAVYDALYNSTGVSAWDNAQAQQTVSNTILEGVGAAIGKSAVSPYADKAAEYAQQLANQRALMQDQIKDRMKTYDIDPTTYFSADEVARMNNEIAKKLDYWVEKGYIDRRGNITPDGMKELKNGRVEKAKFIPTDSPSSTDENGNLVYGYWTGEYNTNTFRGWAESIKNSPYSSISHGQGKPYQYITNYYNRTRRAIDSGELATGTANFDVYRMTLSDQDDKNRAIGRVVGALGKDLPIYEAGELSNGSISKGKKLDRDKFLEAVGYKDGKVTAPTVTLINSPSTNTDTSRGIYGQQLIEVNGVRYLIPSGTLGNNHAADLSNSALRVQNANSRAEIANELNNMNFNLASILTNVKGTDIKPNDGTYNWFLGR